jgi:hypothetical protein
MEWNMTFNLSETHNAEHDEREALYEALNNFFLVSPGTTYCRHVGAPIRAVVASDYDSFSLDDVQAVPMQGSPVPNKFVSLRVSRMMEGFLRDELQIVYGFSDEPKTKFRVNIPAFPGVHLSRPLLPGDVELTFTER